MARQHAELQLCLNLLQLYIGSDNNITNAQWGLVTSQELLVNPKTCK